MWSFIKSLKSIEGHEVGHYFLSWPRQSFSSKVNIRGFVFFYPSSSLYYVIIWGCPLNIIIWPVSNWVLESEYAFNLKITTCNLNWNHSPSTLLTSMLKRIKLFFMYLFVVIEFTLQPLFPLILNAIMTTKISVEVPVQYFLPISAGFGYD